MSVLEKKQKNRANLANRGLFNTPLMFVALFVLMTIALALYGLVSASDALLLRWKRVE